MEGKEWKEDVIPQNKNRNTKIMNNLNRFMFRAGVIAQWVRTLKLLQRTSALLTGSTEQFVKIGAPHQGNKVLLFALHKLIQAHTHIS